MNRISKHCIFLLLLTAINTIGYAQFNTYHPFPSANASWAETTWWETFCDGNYVSGSKDFEYRLVGDTIINSKEYHKLNISGGSEWLTCKSAPSFTLQKYDSIAGFIREDGAHRIYYCNPGKKIGDTLLYDFNLKVGDILPDTYINKRSKGNRVLKIDSVLVGNTYRKEYVISADSVKPFARLIEGVGSTLGLLEPIKVPFEAGCSLNCYSNGDITANPGLNNASMANSTALLKVYADKAYEMFTITYNLPQGYKDALLKIYNIRGELMNIKPVSKGESPVTDNVYNLLDGIYYYTLSANNKVLASYKFIVLK
jgi:hypothetical protein